MKYFGKKIAPIEATVVVIPRQSGDIIFRAQPVLNYDEFEALCPEPLPSESIKPGGARIKNVKSPKYLDAMEKWARSRINWMMIKSLEATEGLEWENVILEDSDTWGNLDDELQESGFSIVERSAVLSAVMDACGLSQGKIDKATKSFLAIQAEGPVEKSTPIIEQSDTESGEPVSESESDPQE